MNKNLKGFRAPYEITDLREKQSIGNLCGVSALDVAELDALASNTGKPYYTCGSICMSDQVYCAEYYTGFADSKVNGWKVTCYPSREMFIDQMDALTDRLNAIEATAIISFKGMGQRIETNN